MTPHLALEPTPVQVRPSGLQWSTTDHRPAGGISELVYPGDAVLLVAGIPGAGKSTLLRRLFDPAVDVVLDSELIGERYVERIGPTGYPLVRPLVHAEHHARIARELQRPGSLVIHHTATLPALRRWIAQRAVANGHSFHLLVLEVERDQAASGQRARRRVVSPRSLDRHVERWERMRTALDEDGGAVLRDEQCTSIMVLDRRAVDELEAIRFDARAPLAVAA